MRPLSDNRTYFTAVTDYFLERTGHGLVLSSRDLELLLSWRNAGASAAIVCKGIDEAAEVLDGGPRDINACRKYVEMQIEDMASIVGLLPAGAAPAARMPSEPDPPDETSDWTAAESRLHQAIERSGRTEIKQAYARALGRLTEGRSAGADPWNVCFELDDWLVDAVFEALTEDERRRIDLEIEGKWGAHLALMTDDARDQTMRASRREALQTRFGLVRLSAEG